MNHSVKEKLETIPEFSKAETISIYISKKQEVKTEDLIKEKLTQGRTIVVPLVDEGSSNLRFSQIRSFEEELEGGNFGVLEPKDEFRRIRSGLDVDVVLVPGVVWSEKGYRIGYGRGYYDRYLTDLGRKVPTIGLSFEFQLLPETPIEQQDVPVQIITTERRVIRCRS